ncbi:group 1 glycosyl transferase [Coraliomargarita sinensis]|uniref:Group 1 glycosyl transferase n=1 Tax=Coraliomargarita sinensis TaxID=2174842 RepID=A0A317ZP15_9BACT|nr:glycosyltransferase [Coraliomargarita sinensis]PXA05091.1 group 1 glycosyl transferase [Coraliomargarita sinensis]
MKALVIGKVWPEPTSSAAGTRTMGLIEAFLDDGWTVTFATAAQATEHSVDLEAMGTSTRQIRVNDETFDHWVHALAPNYVVFDRYMTEEQFGWRIEKACPDAVRILDTSDLHCLREAREQQLKLGGELDLFNDVALREIAAIFRSDISLMISEFEIECLQSVFQVPADQLFYLPLMLDAPVESSFSYEDRKDFVMIGSYLHPPNWDAVRWCCAEIWPLIRRQLPGAELHLYGSYEPDKARRLGSPGSGIYSQGRADEALKTLERYRVNLAPLRFGAGQKGKVVDGFCSGTPTVATPIAAESMNGSIDWGCPIQADAAGLAKTAVDVHSQPELWGKVQQQGYRIIEERFLASQWKPRLVEALRSLRPETREQHFIGRMLRHHRHRSTEYMSRWIEAKNRFKIE